MKQNPAAGQGLFLPNGHLSDEGVGLSVDALKLERYIELPTEIRYHLEECQECRANVTGVFALTGDEKYARDQIHPYLDARSKTDFSIWYKIAAGLVVLVGAGVLVTNYVINKRSSVSSQDKTSSPVYGSQTGKEPPVGSDTTREGKAQTLASRLEPDPEMEALVNAQMRSAEVKVLVHANGAGISGAIVFDWTGGPKRKCTITIYNNTRDRVLSSTVDGPPMGIHQTLPAGLYYWKLECGGELLYFGKFIVQ